jgi:hypothetical protein
MPCTAGNEARIASVSHTHIEISNTSLRVQIAARNWNACLVGWRQRGIQIIQEGDFTGVAARYCHAVLTGHVRETPVVSTAKLHCVSQFEVHRSHRM